MGKIAILAGTGVGWNFAKAMIVIHPDRIGFIEQNLSSVTIKSQCKLIDIPCFDYINEEHTLKHIVDHDITTVVLAWWPHIVKKIQKLGINVINTHPSYLPYNRGKHPYHWAIVDGTPFGVTIHRVDDGIDTGDILWQKRIELTPLDVGETARNKSVVAMDQLLLDHINEIAREDFPVGVPQSECQATSHIAQDMFDDEELDYDGLYNGGGLLDDLRARTFRNRRSGKRVKINGKTYRIHVKFIEEDLT